MNWYKVYNDVAALVDDENILRKGAAEAVPTYNLEQFLPVEVPNSKDKLWAENYFQNFETLVKILKFHE